jgi:hypothetical protein
LGGSMVISSRMPPSWWIVTSQWIELYEDRRTNNW